MAAQIIVNQAGASAGVAGQAREDLVTGVPVALSVAGGPFSQYQWSIIDKPVKYLPVVSASLSSAAVTTPTGSTTSVTPIDNPGTYLIQLLVNSGSGLGATPADVSTITFYAGPVLNATPNALPRRAPAFGERVEHNVPDILFTLLGGLNKRGWAQEWGRWFEVIKGSAVALPVGWARVQLTGAGATIINATSLISTVTRTGVGVCTVTFSAPGLPNANYAVIGSARGLVGGSVAASGELTSGFTIERGDPFGMQVDSDFSFMVLSQ